MITIDALRSFGANVDEGLSRMMGNEAFYLRLVGMGLSDSNFDKLSDALAKDDLDNAFEAAHALKGVLANLALTPLTQTASEMTELLRSRTKMDYSAMLADLLAKRDQLVELKNQG